MRIPLLRGMERIQDRKIDVIRFYKIGLTEQKVNRKIQRYIPTSWLFKRKNMTKLKTSLIDKFSIRVYHSSFTVLPEISHYNFRNCQTEIRTTYLLFVLLKPLVSFFFVEVLKASLSVSEYGVHMCFVLHSQIQRSETVIFSLIVS